MKFIPQLFNNDCGIACLKMMLAKINHDDNYQYLNFKEKKENYSYFEITRIGELYGLYLIGFRVDNKKELLSNTNYPIIVTLNYSDDVKHAVVIETIRRNKVIYYDPTYGKRKMSINTFLQYFDGTGLLIDHYVYTKYKSYPEKPKTSINLSATLLQIFSAISLVLAIHFISQDSYIFLPIIFFSLAAISEVILKATLFKQMKKLDRKTFNENYIQKRYRQDFLSRYEDYKRQRVVTPVNLLTSFMISFIFIFVMLMNSVDNLVLIIVSLFLVVLDVGFLSPLIARKQEAIERNELQVYSASNRQQFIDSSRKLFKRSYTFGKLVILKRYVYILVMLFATIMVMIASKIVSVPFVFFYTCLEYSLFQNLLPLFSYQSLKKKYQISYLKFLNIIHQNDEM